MARPRAPSSVAGCTPPTKRRLEQAPPARSRTRARKSRARLAKRLACAYTYAPSLEPALCPGVAGSAELQPCATQPSRQAALSPRSVARAAHSAARRASPVRGRARCLRCGVEMQRRGVIVAHSAQAAAAAGAMAFSFGGGGAGGSSTPGASLGRGAAARRAGARRAQSSTGGCLQNVLFQSLSPFFFVGSAVGRRCAVRVAQGRLHAYTLEGWHLRGGAAQRPRQRAG